MNSHTLYNANDPYNPYYLSMHKDLYAMPDVDHSAQKQLPLQKPQDRPKFSVFDILTSELPAWAYCGLRGFGSLIGLALAIVFFGFALHFIIVHGSSLF